MCALNFIGDKVLGESMDISVAQSRTTCHVLLSSKGSDVSRRPVPTNIM